MIQKVTTLHLLVTLDLFLQLSLSLLIYLINWSNILLPFFANWRTLLDFVHALSEQHIFIANFFAHPSLKINGRFSLTRFWSHFDSVNFDYSSKQKLYMHNCVLNILDACMAAEQIQPVNKRQLTNQLLIKSLYLKLQNPPSFRKLTKTFTFSKMASRCYEWRHIVL